MISAVTRCAVFAAEQIGLVEHDEVGAQELVLVDLLQRVVVIDRGVVRLLRRQRCGIVGEAPGGDGSAVDHCNDAVDGDARGDRRPVERLHQRLGQGEPRCFDQDVLGRIFERQQALQGRHEIVRHGAADATVGQLDDAILAACLDAAALEDLAVDADIAELVDDHRQSAALRVLQDVAHQRCFTRAEKAGDDGAGNLGDAGHALSVSGCSNPIGGMREMTPLRKGIGRSPQGTMPFGAR